MKPEDIPQDIWDTAYYLNLYPVEEDGRAYLGLDDYEVIARAIMAEREACAAYMDRRADEIDAGEGNVSHMMAMIFRDEAAAIRNRP